MTSDGKQDEQKTERFNMFMSPSEMKAIDDWAWEKRIRSKSEAVRRLVQIGLLVDGEIEELLDTISGGVKVTSDQSAHLSSVFRAIINRETHGMTFTRDQLWDVLSLAREHADTTEEGLRSLHHTVLTMYNAVAAIVETKSLSAGVTRSQEVIAEANAAVEEAEKRRAEFDDEVATNRYIAIRYDNQTPEQREAFFTLPDDEQDRLLTEELERMRLEEVADPKAFAEKYGLDSRRFWEKPEWIDLLAQKRDLAE